MSDLVKRLRHESNFEYASASLHLKAADEIDRLHEQLVKARDALRAAKEFADDEYSMTADLRHKATISGLCDKIDAALTDD